MNATNPFRKWHDASSPEARARVAAAAETSVAYLDHLAKGRKQASAALAGRIEKALIEEKQFTVNRGDVCATCRECPYFTRELI